MRRPVPEQRFGGNYGGALSSCHSEAPFLGAEESLQILFSITNCGDPSSSQRAGLLWMTGKEFRTYTSAQTPGCADPRRQESDRKCCPADYCPARRNLHDSLN